MQEVAASRHVNAFLYKDLCHTEQRPSSSSSSSPEVPFKVSHFSHFFQVRHDQTMFQMVTFRLAKVKSLTFHVGTWQGRERRVRAVK